MTKDHADGAGDRFNHDHVAFWLWAGLYLTTPFLVFAAWAANRRHEGSGSPKSPELPPGACVAIGAIGALALVTSSVLFLAPSRIIFSVRMNRRAHDATAGASTCSTEHRTRQG